MKKKSGYIMITVLILMMVLSAITYLFADVIYADLAIARNNKASQAAFALAEAGVQEAIYKIQYDTATRNAFLDATPIPPINRNQALISNGSYTVTFQNPVQDAATITATGFYQMGSRKAQRRITENITQSTLPPTWDIGAAMFTNMGSSLDNTSIELKLGQFTIYDGGIFSGWDILTKHGTTITAEKQVKARNIIDIQGTKNCECLIEDDGDPLTIQCSSNPGCVVQSHQLTNNPTPMIDFTTYKNQAIAANQCYGTVAPCNKTFPTSGSLTGVAYVEGDLTINNNFTINGVLAASGNIDVKNILTINKIGSSPSGVITLKTLYLNNGTLNATGLIWTGQETHVNNGNLNLTGGIIAHYIYLNNDHITIHYDPLVMNETLTNSANSSVIELRHWEEQY